MVYLMWGHFAEAEPLMLETLKIKKRVMGEEHMFTLVSMANLADNRAQPLRIAAAEDQGASVDALDAAAQTLLTIVQESLRDPERALGFAKRACALDENNWQLLRSLALAQHETGDTAAAVETQKRVVALMPRGADPEMTKRLAEYEATVKDR